MEPSTGLYDVSRRYVTGVVSKPAVEGASNEAAECDGSEKAVLP